MISTSWHYLPLGEVAEVTAGDPAPQSADSFASDGAPFVRMQDVGRYGRTTNLVDVKDRVAPKISARLKLFPPGSILVPKSGASIRLNHRAILGIQSHVVSHLAVIQSGPRLINKFAFYWLCTVDLSKVAHDAHLPSLKTSELSKIRVPVPPLSDQHRIVRILDEANELRKLRQVADKKTAELIPAIFYEVFGDPGRNEKGWPKVSIGSIAKDIQPGFAQRPDTAGNGTLQLRPLNMTRDGALITDGTKVVNCTSKQKSKYRLEPFDILFNNTNSPDLVGKTVLFALKGDYVFSNHLTRIRVDEKKVLPVFLQHILHGLWRQGYFKRLCTQWVNQAAINFDALSAIEFTLPPLNLQYEFAKRVAEVRGMEEKQAESRKKLDDLFNSLLDRAFKGEL